jgi:uncharacterized RDD family membrane protein YckC
MRADSSPFEPAAPPWTTGATSPPAVPEPRPGGVWRRAFALLVDAVVVWMLLRVGDAATGALGRWDLLARAFDHTWRLVVPAAYFVLLHGSGGRTLGKALAGVRVVAASGEPVGYGRALARYFAWLLSLFTLGVGFLVAAARGDRRALHDLVAATRVVRSPGACRRGDADAAAMIGAP